MARGKAAQLAEVTIEGLTPDGHGLGYIERSQGSVGVEVRGSIPGDLVEVELGRRKKGLRQTFVKKFVEKSSEGSDPTCRHFGLCGGCRWQRLSYEEQLAEKERRVRKLFKPFLGDDSPLFHSIMGCDSPWQYRNKMEYSFSQNREGERFLGLYQNVGRGRVENLEECHLVRPWVSSLLNDVREWWSKTELQAYHPPADTGALRTLTIKEGFRTGDRMVILTVSGRPEYALGREDLESFLELVKEKAQPERESQLSIYLRVQQIAKGRPTQFYLMELHGPLSIREELYSELGERNYELSIGPEAFFQPNPLQAEKFYNRGIELLDLSEGARVYDLYCGTGVWAIFASSRAKEVLGVELERGSLLDAKDNITRNDIKNISWVLGDVSTQLAKRSLARGVEAVIVDPPRAGLGSAVHHLLELSPQKILYVSCNPKTQVEDLAALLEGGYSIQAVQPVDQFPQTVHVENLVLLVKGA